MSAPFYLNRKQCFGALLSIFFTSRSILTVLAQVNGVLSSDLQTVVNHGPYAIAEQGPHHKIWKRVTWFTNTADGSFWATTNSYTEIATGISYLANGQWVDASDQIQVTQTGAAVSNSQHKVVFLANLNSAGSVTTITPDGKSLSTSILGLSFLDESSGKSVLIAEVKDSYGQILPSGSEALYPDAFTDVSADVLYVNSVHGLEQFVVLRSQIPDPAQWGLNPDTTVLQVITEFVGDIPEPQITRSPLDPEQDDHLDFGVMQMPRGAAFMIGAEGPRVPVVKHWVKTSDGRTCLVEQVRLIDAQAQLQNLPPRLPARSARQVFPAPQRAN